MPPKTMPLPARAPEPRPPSPTPTTPPPARADHEVIRMMPRGERGYRVRPADLRFYAGPCPACGGSAPRLAFKIPPGFEYPVLDQVGGYTAFFEPRPCSRCQLEAVVARLLPAPQGPAVVDPAQEELARLRAELTRPSAPEAPPSIPGALFDLGRTLITPSVGLALFRVAVGRAEGSIAAGHHVAGHAHAVPLVERHARGDWGSVGSFKDGDADLGALMNPLAAPVDRNAASIKDGRGSVVSLFRVGFEDTRPDPANYNIPRLMHKCDYHIKARTELGGHAPLTLVALADEF